MRECRCEPVPMVPGITEPPCEFCMDEMNKALDVEDEALVQSWIYGEPDVDIDDFVTLALARYLS